MSENGKPNNWKEEFKPLFQLAFPIALTNIGNVLFSSVDIAIAGRLSSLASAGVAAASNCLSFVFVAGIGLITALDPIVSQSRGEGNKEKTISQFFNGLWVVFVASIVGCLTLAFIAEIYPHLTNDPEVAASVVPFLRRLNLSLPFAFLGFMIQRYWQAWQITLPFVITMALGNVLNYFLSSGFALGKYGFEFHGYLGIADSTFFSRAAVAFILLIYSFFKLKKESETLTLSFLKPKMIELKELFRIGLPSSLQCALEVGAFALSTQLCTFFGAVSVSAHQIVLNAASLTFMVPLSIGNAASVRVGFWVGAKEFQKARQTGWLALIFSAAFMSFTGIVMALFPKEVSGLFILDSKVIGLSTGIFFFAAFFQIFDGIQASLTSVFRGYEETQFPMLANLFGHYAIGLPVSLLFAFQLDWKVEGLWLGLSSGLFVVSVLLFWKWMRPKSENALV